MHPFYRQNLKHLDLALRETLQPSITSDLLKSIVEQLRLELGLPGSDGNWQLNVFAPCLTHGWFLDLLQFCEDEDIAILDDCPSLLLLSTCDVFLMRSFADGGYRGNDLSMLNDCRMYLESITLADLCIPPTAAILRTTPTTDYDNPDCGALTGHAILPLSPLLPGICGNAPSRNAFFGPTLEYGNYSTPLVTGYLQLFPHGSGFSHRRRRGYTMLRAPFFKFMFVSPLVAQGSAMLASV